MINKLRSLYRTGLQRFYEKYPDYKPMDREVKDDYDGQPLGVGAPTSALMEMITEKNK